MKAFKDFLSKKAVDIFCDVCGKGCKNSELVEDISMAEFAILEAYWKLYFIPLEQYPDICKSCFDKIVDFTNEKNQI